MAPLIGRIALQPAMARPGESVRVEIFDADDKPFPASAQISINGVPGALQFLQFPSVGQRRVIVRAVIGKESDQQVALLDVQGAPVTFPSAGHQDDIAIIGVTQSQTQPYLAVLTLGSFIEVRSPHLLHFGPSVPSRLGRALKAGSRATRLVGMGALSRAMMENARTLTRIETRQLTNTRRRKRSPVDRHRVNPVSSRIAIASYYDLTNVDVSAVIGRVAKAPAPLYEWEFGDGHTTTTRTPTVSHDYFAAINHATGIGQFVVTCNIKHAGLSVKRTLTIGSAYTICKRTGTVVPHVAADLFAHKRYNMLSGTFTVHNVEDQPMILDRLSVTPTTEDGDAPALPRPFVSLKQPITVAAKSKYLVSVNVPIVTGNPTSGQLRFDVKGFTALYAGRVGDLPVRCPAPFDVPVAEWSKKPQPPKIPDINVPVLERDPWPWELVEQAVNTVVNPAVNPAGVVSLDAKTGTLAVSLGPLRDMRTKAEARDCGLRVVSAVFAPIDEKSAAGVATRPAARAQPVPAAAAQCTGTTAARTPIARAQHLEMRRQDFSGGADFGARDMKLPYFPPSWSWFGGSGSGLHALSGPPMPGPVFEGEVCDPDNLTEEDLAMADDAQLVCQLTSETMDVTMPARWMNARKGDCILSPGGDGIIGGLMLNVEPPQWYSHSGIMTRNYDEITHSTGSQKRIMDHMIGLVSDGSDGFLPSVLKWVWPGAITQTVQHSIEGESFPDPEYDASYSLSPFGPHTVGVTHNDQMKMIPPLVLKPDPMQETPAVRSALHAIASDARSAGGRPGVKSKFHYRWFCYTDPTIGLGAPEGSEAGWAEGTRPSVCSAFIWMHAKAHGARLETDQALVTPTDLEQSDVDQGAAVRPTTPDGLYNYSKKERTDAANWLYDTIYNQAYEKAGWFGEILTDGADDVANQFLNVFANDNADGKDSEDWKNVADADAVSPDNMLWWDGPPKGGLFGYAEPAIYREPRVESYTVSRWKKVLSRGKVHGHVFASGAPVGGALVQVYDGKTTFTAADGSYALDDVPLGAYTLKASKVIDGVLNSAQVDINLQVADLVVDISLLQPPDRFRIAQIFIDFFGRDYETFGDDELLDPGPEYLELELGPDKLINTANRTYHWGGEVRVEYVITVRLLVNNTIDCQVQGTLFEGTSEDTDDLDGTGSLTFQSAVGATAGATLTITNTDEDDDDAGVLSISVKNVRNTN